MTKSLIRAVLIPCAFVAAYFFPQMGSLNFMMKYILMGMLYFVCLNITWGELNVVKQHLFLFLYTLASAVGLWFIFRLAGHETFGCLLFFIAISPTATASPAVVKFLGGYPGFALTSFLITNIGISVCMPLILPFITGNASLEQFTKIIIDVLGIINIPLGLAALTRKIFPDAGKKLKCASDISFGLWIVLICIIVSNGMNFISEHRKEISGMMLFLIFFSGFLIAVVNVIFGRMMGGKNFRLETGQCCLQRNTGFTIVLALQYANPLVAMGPTCYMFWHNIFNAVQLYLAGRKCKKEKLHDKTN